MKCLLECEIVCWFFPLGKCTPLHSFWLTETGWFKCVVRQIHVCLVYGKCIYEKYDTDAQRVEFRLIITKLVSHSVLFSHCV